MTMEMGSAGATSSIGGYMSYASETKRELCRLKMKSKIEALLEITSMLRLNATVLLGSEGVRIRFLSENLDVAQRIAALLKYLYGLEIEITATQNEQLQRRPIYSAIVSGNLVDRLLADASLDLMGNYTAPAERILARMETAEKSAAFLRGAFLGGGTITNPEKSYHLEFDTFRSADAQIIGMALSNVEIESKSTRRKDRHVVYLKDSKQISDFLVSVGAMQAMLKLEDVKAMKDLRNGINRKVNAETANMDKSIDASFKQIQAIEKIQQTVGIETLPESLQAVAWARLENPDANLRELGQLMEPRIGKSGANHRLKRIIAIADDL